MRDYSVMRDALEVIAKSTGRIAFSDFSVEQGPHSQPALNTKAGPETNVPAPPFISNVYAYRPSGTVTP